MIAKKSGYAGACHRARIRATQWAPTRPASYGRASSNSGHVGDAPIASEFCVAEKFRDVPETDSDQSSAESGIEKLESRKHLRGHEGRILMMGARQNREGRLRPFL
jgi:hypothetical protein